MRVPPRTHFLLYSPVALSLDDKMNSKVRKLYFPVCIACLFAGATWVFLSTPDPEPRYGHMTLTECLSWYRVALKEDATESAALAEEAIRTIGTNALPILLQRLSYKNSRLKQKSAEVIEKILHLKLEIRTEFSERLHARLGFRALGPMARPAIPQLTEMLGDPGTSPDAASCLAAIGPEVVPLLTNVLNNPDARIRGGAASALADFRGDKLPANVALALLPLLKKLTDDPDANVRSDATSSLAAIGCSSNVIEQSESIITHLIAKANDPAGSVRYSAVTGLSWFGRYAQTAIPHLERLTDGQDDYVRFGAARALGRISRSPGMIEKSDGIRAFLIGKIDDPDSYMRAAIAEQFGWYGKQGQAMIPHLERLMSDPDSTVREKAEASLALIQAAIETSNAPSAQLKETFY